MKKLVLLSLVGLSFMSTSKTVPFEKLIGQYNEKQDSTFISLDSTELPTNKSGMYLQKEPTEKLIQIYHNFKNQHPDIPFVIVSATRNYSYQRAIWQRKWQALYPKLHNSQKIAEEILKYSSMPGSSRHHWGTDIDITSVSSDYFKHDKKGKILYRWLQENMPKHGFCQPYNEGRKKGYQPEEWHWSYMPISKIYLNEYRKILKQDPKKILNKLDFIGHDKITIKKLLSDAVLSVNKNCY